jgi:hypothetical protein
MVPWDHNKWYHGTRVASYLATMVVQVYKYYLNEIQALRCNGTRVRTRVHVYHGTWVRTMVWVRTIPWYTCTYTCTIPLVWYDWYGIPGTKWYTCTYHGTVAITNQYCHSTRVRTYHGTYVRTRVRTYVLEYVLHVYKYNIISKTTEKQLEIQALRYNGDTS